jgi:hypothetical protein
MTSCSTGRGVLLYLFAAFVSCFGFSLGSSPASSRQSEENGAEDVSGLAYFQSMQGHIEPVRLPLTANEDSSWSNLVFFESSGPKARLSIGSFEIGGRKKMCGQTSARLIEDWLAESIAKSGRFEIVGSGPSASYLLHGSILDCALGVEAATGRRGLRTAVVSISLRVTSTATGQVLFSTVEHSRIFDRDGSGYDRSPDGAKGRERFEIVSALRASVNKAVYRLVEWADKRPWSGKVVAVEDGRVTIDAGFRQGLAEAMVLHAVGSGRELIDPESGRILGSVSEQIGRLQIVEVRENLAIAVVLEGCEGIGRGDRVELRDPPPVSTDRPPDARLRTPLLAIGNFATCSF